MAKQIPPSGSKVAQANEFPPLPGQSIHMPREQVEDVNLSELTPQERERLLKAQALPRDQGRADSVRAEALRLAQERVAEFRAQGGRPGASSKIQVTDLEDLPDTQQNFVQQAIQSVMQSVSPEVARGNPAPPTESAASSLFEDEEEPETVPEPVQEAPVRQGSTSSVFLDESDTPPPLGESVKLEDALAPAKHLCKWCGSDPKSEPPEPTQADYLAYIEHIAGGRFRKTYELYDGHVQVTFQNLTPSEETAIFTQLDEDMRLGKATPTTTVRAVYYYRLAASIAAFQVGKTGMMRKLRTLAASLPGHKPDTSVTPLPERIAALEESLFSSESVRTRVMARYLEFSSLMAAIEARGLSDDGFFGPIGGG